MCVCTYECVDMYVCDHVTFITVPCSLSLITIYIIHLFSICLLSFSLTLDSELYQDRDFDYLME